MYVIRVVNKKRSGEVEYFGEEGTNAPFADRKEAVFIAEQLADKGWPHNPLSYRVIPVSVLPEGIREEFEERFFSL